MPRTPGRAPRLAPDQRIAPHITRVGRFRAIDPARPKRPPSPWAVLGRLGWALLVAESLRRAWARSRRTREDSPAPEAAAPWQG